MTRVKTRGKTQRRSKTKKPKKPSIAGRRANRPPPLASGRVGQSVWMSPALKKWVTARANRAKMSASAWIAARLEELRATG